MVVTENVFDLWDILANELVGDPWLFVVFGAVVILIITVKADLPMEISIMSIALWLLIVFAEIQSFVIILAFILLVVGLLFYKQLEKWFKR